MTKRLRQTCQFFRPDPITSCGSQNQPHPSELSTGATRSIDRSIIYLIIQFLVISVCYLHAGLADTIFDNEDGLPIYICTKQRSTLLYRNKIVSPLPISSSLQTQPTGQTPPRMAIFHRRRIQYTSHETCSASNQISAVDIYLMLDASSSHLPARSRWYTHRSYM